MVLFFKPAVALGVLYDDSQLVIPLSVSSSHKMYVSIKTCGLNFGPSKVCSSSYVRDTRVILQQVRPPNYCL